MADAWPLAGSHTVYDAGLFRVSRDRVRSPRTGRDCTVHVIHMADWLMVLPLTTDHRFVMVRQYRHGARRTGLEFPGGLRDASDSCAAEGAARELAEETGYGGGELMPIGELAPQPALLATRARFFLARGVARVAEPRPDPGEDLEVQLIDAGAVDALVRAGEIHNAMAVAALTLLRLQPPGAL